MVQLRVVVKERDTAAKRVWRVVRSFGTGFIPTGLRSTMNGLEGFKLWSVWGEDEGKLPFPSGEGNSRIGVSVACRNTTFFNVRVPCLLRWSS